jgi:hypothetical protein
MRANVGGLPRVRRLERQHGMIAARNEQGDLVFVGLRCSLAAARYINS